MTLDEMKQYRRNAHYIKTLEIRIKELEALATGTTASLTGMPGGGAVSDKVGRLATEIAQKRDELQAQRAYLIRQRLKIERFIDKVPDLQMRDILYWRHIRCMSWVAIAHRIGGANTDESVRKAHQRFWKYQKE